MITKINPYLTTIRRPLRANLQKTSVLGLGVLAGSSMSGLHGPNFEPTEMIIPGGLDFKEQAYYLLKGKLPKSVVERWFPQSDNYTPAPEDQVVTVNIGNNQYIGDIVEAPHEIGTSAVNDPTIGNGEDISEDFVNAISGDMGDVDNSDNDVSHIGEIFKHLFGAD